MTPIHQDKSSQKLPVYNMFSSSFLGDHFLVPPSPQRPGVLQIHIKTTQPNHNLHNPSSSSSSFPSFLQKHKIFISDTPMSPNQKPPSPMNLSSHILLLLIDIFDSHIRSHKLRNVHKFFTGFLTFGCSTYSRKQQFVSADNERLCREDAEMVMRRLGVFNGEGLGDEMMSSSEMRGLFSEEEASLEEVKEAFDVFDENKDGFIDAIELQRVMCILGLKEGLDLGNCKRMINGFDEDSDGRIDFNEFVKFMENGFC